MKTTVLLLSLLVASTITFAQTNKEAEVKIKTSAICGMCKNAIEKDLAFEKGVLSSDLNLENKVVTVKYNLAKTSPDKIKAAITKAGYDADELTADAKAYSKLPDCCRKETTPHID